MTLDALFELIKTTYEGIEGVQSVYSGDAALMWNTQEVKYASVAFTLQSTRENNGNLYHTFRIYAGDRLTDDQTNRDELYSKLYGILHDGLNALSVADGINGVEDNRVYEYAPLKMFDVLAVCTLTATIVVPLDTDC